MTEEDACRTYATAWNRLAPDDLINVLDEDVRYTSQAVLLEMRGKQKVAEYLRQKMDTVRSSPAFKVLAELAETQPYPMYPNAPRPCVVVAQGKPENLVATVLFTVASSKIIAIDICVIPPPYTTKRLGEFPR
jgi:hypothetical protein